jgi:hypothetical protein
MKRNIVAVGMLLLFSAVLWSCSDSDSPKTSDETAKEALTTKTQDLKTAVEDITESKGFEIITMSDNTKTDDGGDDTRFSASITLEDIKGLYEYNVGTDEATEAKFGFMQNVFTKTKDTTLFILQLPKEKAYEPWKLYMQEDGDDALVNDFKITTTEYNYSFSMDQGFDFDYSLEADIEVEDVEAGGLDVEWSIESNLNFQYSAEYDFTDDYEVGVEFEFGEEIGYEYYLEKADEVLFKERIEVEMEEGSEEKTYIYSLMIGNIEIKKKSDSEEYEVYKDGELDADAVVEHIQNTEDDEDRNLVFCRKGLDIKITFADGTEVILSELLGEDTLNKMSEIFESMYDMYFVKHLVDKVAHQVYQENQAQL